MPEAMRLLARIGMARDVLDDAESCWRRRWRSRPTTRRRATTTPTCWRGGTSTPRRASETRRLLALAPDNADYRALAATAAVGLGDNEAAISIYRDLLAAAPASPDLNLWMGHALKTVGRLPEAIDGLPRGGGGPARRSATPGGASRT